ncbi:zinc finger BED domain-containing protein RICESLEEPER 2-like [Carex rostrata]
MDKVLILNISMSSTQDPNIGEDDTESYNSIDHDDEMPLGMDGESREQVEHVQNNTDANPTLNSAKNKGRKLRSKVWIDFDKKELPDGSYNAQCKHCKIVLSAGAKRGTSHLKYHLDHSCDAYKRVKRQKIDVHQQLLKVNETKEDGTTKVESFEFKQERSRSDYARMVVAHEYPFNMANHLFFRVFVKNLQPQFRLNKRNTIRSDCVKLYQEEKVNLYNVLDKINCRVSLTTDMWTSASVQGFLCLTCHYIDDNWKMQKRILNFVRVPSPHTSEHLCEVIMAKLLDWNIDKKIFSIVLDNCTTNDAVVREMLYILKPKNVLPVDGELFHVRCGAHILNIIVQDGLEALRDVIRNIRETVKYIRHSPSRIERFEKVLRQVRAPQTKLFYDVPTRWNSTFLMLINSLKFREAFSRLADVDRDYKLAPSSKDWDNVVVIVGCLQIFYDTTMRISGTKYPTINIFFNEFCEVYLSIRSSLISEHSFVVNMATRMCEKFQKYWCNSSVLLAIASILDPRSKLKSVEYYFRLIYNTPGEAEFNVTNVKACLHKLFSEYVVIDSRNRNGSHGSNSNAQNASSHTGESSQRLYSNRRHGLVMYIQESYTSEPTKSELDVYLEERTIPGMDDDSFDILAWWKCNASKYPILSNLVRDVLGTPVSTVASESAFSTAGRVLDDYRSSLSPTTVEALICTQDWLRAFATDESSNVVDGALSSISESILLDGEIDLRGIS